MPDQTEPGGADDVNPSVWSAVADQYAIEGWADPGELGALTAVADEVRGRAILDLGVGGGRTIGLLRLLSHDYLGLDYTLELVDLCRRRHPAVDVRLGDARELTDVPTSSKGFVLFSNNGIDAVDHQDRSKVLDEVHRVLEPGGIFLVSTLNKDSPLFGAHPGTAPSIGWQPGTLLPALEGSSGSGGITGDDGESWVRALRNWRRLSPSTVDAGEWGMAPFAAHEFALLTHFITVPAAIAELDHHGLETTAVFPCDATQPLEVGAVTEALYVHLVATRRP